MTFTIGRKLAAMALMGVALVVAAGYAGYAGVLNVDAAMDQIVAYAAVVRNQGIIDNEHDALRGDVLDALTMAGLGRGEERQRIRAKADENARDLREALAANERLVTDRELLALMARTSSDVRQYSELAGALVNQAFDDRPAALARLGEFEKAFLTLGSDLEKLTARFDAEAKDAQRKGDTSGELAKSTVVWVAIASTLLLLVVSFLITSNVTRRLGAAVVVTRRVASGDLTGELARGGADEIGTLQDAMSDMVEKLRQIIGEVRGGAEALTAASGQVSATSQALAQGTGEQAASVEETTSSLEEMSASITQNAENSRQSEQMASRAARDADESGRAVSETVEAMRSIAEKISIIEEMAYQTNLLALNAAIEAARAGEHGKGFAVVAQEVRKLAERAQKAAGEIGTVASASVKLAECSSHLLTELVPAIKKTADLVQEVAAASQEQSSGVGQINKAMGAVDQVTQRNASAAEELSSTAEEMASQAESLQQLMAFFQVKDGHDAAARLAPPRTGAPAGHPPAVHLPAPPHLALQPSASKSARTNGAAADAQFRRF